MSKKVIAAIDVGSHAIRMKIGEINRSGKFKELESFRKVVLLGHDTFTKGKLSFQSVDKVCDYLKLFKKTFADYGVEIYSAKATSAIREASNRDYIVDQIRLKTGLDIDVIGNQEEQFLTHKAIKERLQEYQRIIMDGAVFVVIGAGSIQITTYKNGILQFSQNVKMGALRIKEAFEAIEDKVLDFSAVLDEYISTNLENVAFFQEMGQYEHLIAVGGEIRVISALIAATESKEVIQVSKKKFNKIYNQFIKMNTEEIEETYKIKRERADIILPSILLFNKFLQKVSSDTILVPEVSLTDGIIRLIHEELTDKKISTESVADIVSNARLVAEKFNYNAVHAAKVEELALILFDRLKKLHGLSEERLLLQVATILHDIGKIVCLDRHAYHSYQIIRSLEIFGLSEEQLELVANISYYHSRFRPSLNDPNFKALPRNERAIVGKLAAILKLCEALDRAHKSKIRIESIKNKEKTLLVNCTTGINVDTTLEELTFQRKAEFFTEVFGVTPILKIRRELNG